MEGIGGDAERESCARAAVALERTHQRFLLRQQEFTVQYSPMYECRVNALKPRVISAMRKKIHSSCHAAESTHRVFDLKPGHRDLCVGVLYRETDVLPRFLDEYQKDLVRIDGGEDDGEGGGVENNIPSASGPQLALEMNGKDGDSTKVESNGNEESKEKVAAPCGKKDKIFLEDSSGRVLLEGIPVELLCTGIVMCVDGTLGNNGRVLVHNYSLVDLREIYVPRLLPSNTSQLPPCYIGIVCGLELEGLREQEKAGTQILRTMMELLVNYLSGELGNDAMRMQARDIAHLVIGGNSISLTDDLRLKDKVKLEPSDHAQLSGDRKDDNTITSVMHMKAFDDVLKHIAETIDVDLMPGETDMSNAFHPQQPIHPILLPEAARRSSLKLVTNPYEFHVFPSDHPTTTKTKARGAKPEDGGTIFFVSSGSNLDDMYRQTSSSRLDTMSMILHSGCACPTAPNTLYSYPFKASDPFVFEKAPHCFICCNQPKMEDRWVPLEEFSRLDENVTNEEALAGEGKTEDSSGVRLICVPPFSKTGILVLVDVNSPQLNTISVNLAPSSLSEWSCNEQI